MDLTVPVDHTVKQKESEKRDEYIDLARELKNLWDKKVTEIPIVIGTLGSHQWLFTRAGGLGNKSTSRGEDHPNNSIAEINQNNERNLRDSRRLAVTLVKKTTANASEKNSQRSKIIIKHNPMNYE